MTDLFSDHPAATNRRHPRFAIGDKVRPVAEWRDGKTPPIPSGEVTRVDSFGLGQVIKVGDSRQFYTAGTFELDE